jgi:hypothetical protein
LLEKGLKTVKKSGKYGSKTRAAAIPDISLVEKQVQEEFGTRLKNAIEYQK